jgi:hypothetical protein
MGKAERYGEPWTKAEDEILRAKYPREGADVVASMTGRTVSGVRKRVKTLGIANERALVNGINTRPWLPKDDSVLRKNYLKRGSEWVAKKLERSARAVIDRATYLGIRRPRCKFICQSCGRSTFVAANSNGRTCGACSHNRRRQTDRRQAATRKPYTPPGRAPLRVEEHGALKVVEDRGDWIELECACGNRHEVQRETWQGMPATSCPACRMRTFKRGGAMILSRSQRMQTDTRPVVRKHNLEMFVCERYSTETSTTRLTTKGCAARYQRVEAGYPGYSYEACRGCPVGAANAKAHASNGGA